MKVASKLSLFLSELKRRQVYRVAVVYLVVGLGILGAAEVILDPLGLGDHRSHVVILVLLGFPIALVLAWAYELRPEAPRKDRRVATPGVDSVPGGTRKSLVVLPFANLSRDPSDAYFSDGLTEEIIAKLSFLRSLRVISRNSAMALRGTPMTTQAISEELDVQYVLEGSVRRAEDDLRITAQLIDAVADEHLWTETYDRDLADVFQVQTDVAENIAFALRAEFSSTEQERVRRIPTRDLKAYEYFIRAIRAGQGVLPEDLAEAVELAGEAIRIDPEFAEAHAVLASFYAVSGLYANEHPADLYPKLEAAANRALELNPRCGEAHAAMAVTRFIHEWDWAGAEEEFSRALELNPDDPFANLWKAIFLLTRGRFSEAEAASGRGLASDPLSPSMHFSHGQVLAMSGKAGEAIRHLEAAVRRWPKYPHLQLFLGLSHLYAGDPEAALPSIEAGAALSGAVPFFDAMRGVALTAAGRVEDARKVLEDLKTRSNVEYVDPYNLFALTVTLDGFDDAEPYLQEALAVRSYFIPFLAVVPRFKALRADPRFRAVLEKVSPGVDFEA